MTRQRRRTGTIDYRADRAKPWRARYWTPAGDRRSRSFIRESEATRWLRSELGSIDRGHWIDPIAGSREFGDWIGEWHASRHHLRPSSRARDDSYIRSLIRPHLGGVPLGKVTAGNLRNWVGGMVVAGKAPATISKALQLVTGALEAAVRDGLIAANPARHVEAPKIENSEMRFLDQDEVAELAAAIDPRYRTLVWFLVLVGCRIGEAVALEVADLDMLGRTVTITKTATEVRGHIVVGPPKTRRSVRRVTMPKSLVEDLGEHLALRPPGAKLVFPAAAGGYLRLNNWRRRTWNPAVMASVGHCRPHDLRHTAVAWLIAAGEHPATIAQRLGHSSFDQGGPPTTIQQTGVRS